MWSHPIARPALAAVVVKLIVVIAAAWLVVPAQRRHVDAAGVADRLLADGPDASSRPRP